MANSRNPEWACEVNSVLSSKGPQCSPIVRMYLTKGQHAELHAPGKEHAFVKCKKVSVCSHLEQPNMISLSPLRICDTEIEWHNICHF